MRLKQICNFDPATGESAKLEQLAADLEEVAASGRKAIVFSPVGRAAGAAWRGCCPPFGPLQYHGKSPAPARRRSFDQFRKTPAGT